MRQTAPPSLHFIPHLCTRQNVLLSMLMAQLLAFCVMLIQPPSPHIWHDLLITSAFIHWLVLSIIIMMGCVRHYCPHLSLRAAMGLCYLIIIVTTGLLSTLVIVLQAQVNPDIELGYTGYYFIVRNLVISAILGAPLLRYFYIQQQWKVHIETETRAKIDALQARIRPHFLFNSMNIIASLIHTRPDVAEQAVEDLSDLFRASLNETLILVPFASELELCQGYLRIEQLRLGTRLKVHWNIASNIDTIQIPALSLQPLVENAVYHGIAPLPKGGEIHFQAIQDNNRLVITITNPLTVDHTNTKSKGSGFHMAHYNIKQRLAAIFAGQAQFSSEQNATTYTVTLSIPCILQRSAA